MDAWARRLSAAERDAAALWRKRNEIPVLFVRENPEGAYRIENAGGHKGKTMGADELRRFAEEHNSCAIINNDLPEPEEN